MAVTGKIGVPVSVQFALYEADAFTRIVGAAAEIVSALFRSTPAGGRELTALPIAIAELADQPGEYVAFFTPDVTDRTYTLILRHAQSSADVEETIQVWTATPSDLDAAIGGVADQIAVDVIVDVTNVDAVVVGEPWLPRIRFRRKSTFAPFDPEPLVSVEVLDGAGEVVQLIAGDDAVRVDIGQYTVSPDPVALAGVVFLRITFRPPGGDDDLVDVFRVQVAAPAAEAAAGGGATSRLEHVYTCPSFLEDAGYDLDGLSNRVRWDLIKAVSADIDGYTQQWFNGDLGTWDLDGRGRRLAAHKSNIPIHGVVSVTVVAERTNRFNDAFQATSPDYVGTAISLDAGYWVAHPRAIERVRSTFPGGAKNVQVEAVLGWIEGYRDLRTTSAEDLLADANALVVTDVSGFQVRDVVEVVGDADAVRVILTGVSRAQSRIFFDPVAGILDPIPVGAEVRTFGQVPRPIERVANYLFGCLLRERAAFAAGEEPVDVARIRSERTDDYSYELFGPSSGAGGEQLLTGNVQYDRILREFSAPAVLRMV